MTCLIKRTFQLSTECCRPLFTKLQCSNTIAFVSLHVNLSIHMFIFRLPGNDVKEFPSMPHQPRVTRTDSITLILT